MTMQRWTAAALAGGLLLAAAPEVLEAQRPQFGVQVDYGSDSDVGIGARVVGGTGRLIPSPRLSLIGSFDVYFPGGNNDFWELNGNVAWRFPVPGLEPYAGGGLNMARNNRDTSAGLNLLVGTWFRIPGALIKPFAELRITLEGAEQFVLTGGIAF
jgi:hypothetical protein